MCIHNVKGSLITEYRPSYKIEFVANINNFYVFGTLLKYGFGSMWASS